MQELALRNVGRPPRDAALLASLPPQHAPAVATSDFCGLLHPAHPGACNQHFAAILPTLFSKSLMVYLPVYVASAVAVHREQLVKRRAAVAPKLLLGTARSSIFLAVYVACAHRGAFRGRSSAVPDLWCACHADAAHAAAPPSGAGTRTPLQLWKRGHLLMRSAR